MKNTFIIAALILNIASAFAGDSLYIHMKDGIKYAFDMETVESLNSSIGNDYLSHVVDISELEKIADSLIKKSKEIDDKRSSLINIREQLDFELKQVNQLYDDTCFVDLGLPSGTLWASHNVGAQYPEEFGGLYAWGEVEPKTEFSWDNYSWDMDAECERTKNEKVATKIAGTEHDAATVSMGKFWEIPTVNDFNELANNCKLTFDLESKIMEIKGKNGKVLLLPMKVSFLYQYSPIYWTSSADDYVCEKAYVLQTNYNQTKFEDVTEDRCKGYPIRPVCKKFNAYKKRIQTKIDTIDLLVDATAYLKLRLQSEGQRLRNKVDSVIAVVTEGDFIDLGLPSGNKWSSRNFGSATPEGRGVEFNAFEFGEEKLQELKEQEPGDWIAPTKDDIYELSRNCDWRYIKRHGVKGLKVTGPNGNSIFIPTLYGGYIIGDNNHSCYYPYVNTYNKIEKESFYFYKSEDDRSPFLRAIKK